jgi:hypothetical protein
MSPCQGEGSGSDSRLPLTKMSENEKDNNAIEYKPVIVDDFVGEYKTLKKSLGLTNPVISYPACGTDISLSKVFPDSSTYCIDIDKKSIDSIKNAGLGVNNHFVNQSAYDYEIPEPVDLVVLRNPSTDKGDVVGLTRGLKKGGYVVESHWGSTYGSQQLLSDPHFKLIGVLTPGKDMDKFTLDIDTNGSISEKLAGDTDIISKFAGRGYLFQKIS